MTAPNRDISRRRVLEAAGASGIYALAGCLGDDEDGGLINGGNGSNPDLDLARQPFQYVLAPQELLDQGLTEEMPAEEGWTIPAGYRDYRSIEEDISDQVLEVERARAYPRPLISVKADEGDSLREVVDSDVDEAVAGKSTSGLVKTSIGYDTMMEYMDDRGYDQVEDRNRWTIFDAVYDYKEEPQDMKLAVNGDFLAYIIDGPLYQEPHLSVQSDRLDDFITLYVDLLSGESDIHAWRDVNDYAAQAEQEFHELGDRDWDMVSCAMLTDQKQEEYRQDGYRPPEAELELLDYVDEQIMAHTYGMHEDGATTLIDSTPLTLNPKDDA